MPQTIQDKETFSLFEVCKSISRTLENRYSSAFWVRAEMNKLNHYSHSGHCYPELLEKDNGKIVAQMRSILWKADYQRINRVFIHVLREPLKDGIKILFLAKIRFDPSYGMSLHILDIDPSLTLGDLERERLETITALRKDGIFDANKMRKMPLLPQRLAIISVETSKGYADFLQVLDQNPWGYKFFHLLFPSLLQGDQAIVSIQNKLNQIRKVVQHFDAVAIIRGGGGDVGLSCFNNHQLSKAIAEFPIPVLTGIGHATNETVVEMVSHANQITPTKVAEHLIQRFHNFSVPVQQAEEKMVHEANQLITDSIMSLQSAIKYFRSEARNHLEQHNNLLFQTSEKFKSEVIYHLREHKTRIQHTLISLPSSSKRIAESAKFQLLQVQNSLQREPPNMLEQTTTKLKYLEAQVHNMSPARVLSRGFSITRLNGHAIAISADLKPGVVLETELTDGRVYSTVNPLSKIKKS
ncbi:MAG: exodeoxyribonuclease VII large subunit [Bacteroidia bacterium]